MLAAIGAHASRDLRRSAVAGSLNVFMSTDKPEIARPGQIGIRGILLFTAGIALSIGLFRLAVLSPFDYFLLLGLVCLSASFGGLVGQLWHGTRSDALFGVLIGGVLGPTFPWVVLTILVVVLVNLLVNKLSRRNVKK